MEKAARVLMVEAGFDWDDVGGWLAVAKYCPPTLRRTAAMHARCKPSIPRAISSSPTTLPLVGLLGVRDLIVVRTGDALLVCHRGRRRRSSAGGAGCRPELQ